MKRKEPTVIRAFVDRANKDERMRPAHRCLMMMFIYLSWGQQRAKPVAVSRRRMMQMTGIKSIVSYHKYMAQLQSYGYITYVPSFHPLYGSMVWINAG